MAQYGRTLVVGGRAQRVPRARVRPGGGLRAARRCTRARSSCTCRTARAAASPRCRTGARGEVFDASTRFVGVGPRRLLPLAAGAAGRPPRAPAPRAGGVQSPAATWPSAGCSSPRSDEHLDVFAVDLHETGPSGGDVHWRGAATGESRASFEGLIQIDPGAQQTHTYLQIHSMMLSPKARAGRDPLGARVRRRRLGLARRHGRRAGRGGDLLHADARPGPPGGGAGDRRGLLRAADRRARRRAAGRARAREDRRASWPRRARTSRRMPPVAESDRADERRAETLDVRATSRSSRAASTGAPLVYLDSGATSQKPAVVIEALAEHLREHNANVHRGVYALAQEADAAYDGARRRVAAFVGARAARRRSSRKNVTEAINLVAYAWGRANVGPGDAVLITQMEHHANIVPWQVLCRERGAELRYLEVDERGELSLEQLDAELARGDVRLVAFTHVSNVLGTINPVAEMAARIARRGRGVAGGRRPGGAAHAGRRRGDRRRLLRLDRPQGARPDGDRRAARPRGDPGGDGAVPDRRRHDRLGRLPVGAPGTSCRTSSRPARRRSPRRSGWARRSTTCRRSGWSACARTSAR